MDSSSYIQALKAASAHLQRIRDEELRNAPHPSAAILALEDAFLYAIKSQPPSPTSGLVEYQRILRRAYPK